MNNELSRRPQGNHEDRPYALLELIGAPVFLLDQERIEYANPAAVTLTGANPDELMGSRFLSWFEETPAGITQGAVPVTAQGAEQAGCLEAALLHGTDSAVECMARLHAGPNQDRMARLVFHSADPAVFPGQDLKPRLLVTVTGVEYAALPGSETQSEMLAGVFTADPGALAVVSGPELTFRMANRAYHALIPDSPQQLVGQQYTQIWKDSRSSMPAVRIRQVIEAGEPLDVDRYEIQLPDGSLRYVSYRVRPMVWNGEPGALLVVWDVTELEETHLRAEQASEVSRRRAAELDAVLNALPDAIVIHTEEGRVRAANQAALEILGFNPVDEPREKIFEQVTLLRMDGRKLNLAEMPSSRALKGQRVRGQRMSVVTTQGQEIQVLASAVPLYSENQLVGSVSVWSDVSELIQRRQELEALVQVASALRDAIVQEEIFPAALEQALHLMKLDGVSILLPDTTSGELVVRAADGEWASTVGQRLAAGTGVSSQVIQQGEPYVNNEIQDHPRLVRSVFAGGLRCGVCVPMRVQDTNIGVVWAGRNTPFTDDEVHLLLAIAAMTASSLHRAQLFEQTQLRFQRLTALHSIDMAITSSLDLQVTLSVLLDQVVSQMRVDAADILLYDPGLHWLEFASGRGFMLPSARKETQQLAETPAGQVALERQVLAIPDLSAAELPIERWVSPQEGFRAYFAAPLISKGQVKGIIELFQREVFHPDTEWLEFLQTLATQAAIALDSAELFTRLQRSNEDLSQAYDATIEGWSRALELRDRETEGHSRRVTEMTIRLARRMGISDEEIAHYRRGVLLHDIGKMAIPDEILLKADTLTPEEQDVMRLHPIYAYDLLKPIAYLRPALDIPYCHHEWWDGRGYPRGLKGEEIPLSARIFTVIDVYDALTNKRTYRPPWPTQKVMEYIRSRSGTQFDPRVVDQFINMIQGYERYHSLPV